MDRVIVTGADGFIGKALVQKLLADGAEVYAVVLQSDALSTLACPSLHVVPADYSCYPELTALLPEETKLFFHLAWAGVSGSAFHDYARQTENIRSACDAAHAAVARGCKRFVFIGSTYMYQYRKESGIALPGQPTLYGAAKECAASMCKILCEQGGVEFVLPFFSNVFGTGDLSRRSTNMLIAQFTHGVKPKLIDGTEDYDCIFINDAVRGLLFAAQKGKAGEQYYIGNRQLKPFRAFVADMRDVLSPDMALTFGEIKATVITDYTRFDLDKLYHDTGFETLCDYKESIRKTAQWLAQSGFLETALQK